MTKKQRDRQQRLLPNGEPRYIRIYDGGEELLDRYTVIYTGNYTSKTGGEHFMSSLSDNPLCPGGFFQHMSYPFQCDCLRGVGKDRTEGNWPPAIGRSCHLGKRIPFSDLNTECKQAVFQDYTELWELNLEESEK